MADVHQLHVDMGGLITTQFFIIYYCLKEGALDAFTNKAHVFGLITDIVKTVVFQLHCFF